MCEKLKNPFYDESQYRKLPDPLNYDNFINVNYNPCDTNHYSQENFTSGRFYRVMYNGQDVGILFAGDMFIFKSKIQNSKTTTFTFYVQHLGHLRFGGYSVRTEYMDELFRAEVVY